MKEQTLKERVQEISDYNKQNLSGRETDDELFEFGIQLGITETEEKFIEMFNTLKNDSIDNVITISNVDLFIKNWKQEL